MDVSAEASVALPARLRPTPDQVCHWYEQDLRAMGAEVQRVAPGRLEFDLPLSQTFFAWNPLASLAPLSRGELEVTATADGFEVSLTGKARAWITWLPVAVFAFGTGGLLFLGTSTRYYLAAGAFLLLGLAWVRTRVSLRRFLKGTNAAVAESFLATPPRGATPPSPASDSRPGAGFIGPLSFDSMREAHGAAPPPRARPETRDMPEVKWSPDLSVGIAEIDAQHQHFLELINAMYRAIRAGKGQAALGASLAGLSAYTHTHFATEEQLMARHGYPGLAEHKAQHDAMAVWVGDIQRRFKSGETSISYELLGTLRTWLMTHIQTVDQRFGSYLRERGVS
jgi:hemerythrin